MSSGSEKDRADLKGVRFIKQMSAASELNFGIDDSTPRTNSSPASTYAGLTETSLNNQAKEKTSAATSTASKEDAESIQAIVEDQIGQTVTRLALRDKLRLQTRQKPCLAPLNVSAAKPYVRELIFHPISVNPEV
ncbi:uncharacterized protein KY384_009207 [Bacidia gigantensis]|uniref:uncharacterized protein n=1 Tax=Bacidia gigantensis TaxID=2732470 RepID=UPI001D048EE4|nr:uncharacterized protein KY384_009207 [Bacidia gigantensis]KAG8525563.1 hypothetical protein KY384_009207 [Bacidia gigantensis]